MKFESKFGLGEIVDIDTRDHERATSKAMTKPRMLRDSGDFGKVIEIVFNPECVEYVIETVSHTGMIQIRKISESRLSGDPDFDQEKGCYPPGLDEDNLL